MNQRNEVTPQNEKPQSYYDAKAKDFYEWLVNNEKMIKKAVRKNTTYDAEIWEDALGEAVVKTIRAITVAHTDIQDFKMYFFTALKWVYIQRQTAKRKALERNERNYFDDPTNDIEDDPIIDHEALEEAQRAIFRYINDMLAERHGQEAATMYLKFASEKIQTGRGYIRFCEVHGHDVKTTVPLLKQMKAEVAQDEVARTMYREFKNN